MITTTGRDETPALKLRPAHRVTRFGIAVSFFFLAVACNEAATAANELEGVWRSRGYGLIAQVTPKTVRMIERTPVSCLAVGEYSTNAFRTGFRFRPRREEGTFTIRHDGTLSSITFERAGDGGFDHLCPAGFTAQSDDPELNFEVLWQTFDQHYAFFTERRVDWDAVFAEFRPKIGKATTRSELVATLKKILERIGDAHVTLYIDDDNVISVASRLEARLLGECRKQREDGCNFGHFLQERYASFNKVLRTKYLKNRFKTAFSESLTWGRIGVSTGYFRIDSMADLVRGRTSSTDDLAALQPVLDRMVNDLGRMPNMIVDVRLNGGGDDAIAVAVASRFADMRRVFGSKRAFEKGRRTIPQNLVVEPADGPRYRGRVAVLTSGETASAAEIFTLAMRALPHVTLVGEATMGILSDELYRILPNGWEFSLSNEIYLAAGGELFEATGVPPDVMAPFLSSNDHRNGADGAIEAAIRILNRENPSR